MMFYGYGRGLARRFGFGAGPDLERRGGVGFGFRGASPPWPYAGRGRGGLSRCSYPGMRKDLVRDWDYGVPWNAEYNPAVKVDSEKEILKDKAEMMKKQLEQIEKRLRELEEKETD